MAQPPDPSQPTARVAPPAAVAPRRVAYHDPDEVLWRDELLRRLRSVTTGLTIAILIAFVALGVSVWALLEDDNAGGASRERVALLEQRVQRLEAARQRTPSSADVATLAAQQKALSDQVAALKRNVSSPADVDAISTAVDAMQQTVQQLDGRVTELEQAEPVP